MGPSRSRKLTDCSPVATQCVYSAQEGPAYLRERRRNFFYSDRSDGGLYIGKWKEGVSGKGTFLREGMGVLCAGARQAAGSGHERKPGQQFVFFYCNKI